jgi:NAD(P)-dependent dehydrogenase (short-subunit alcohol dehydrogenase family)
MNLFGLDGRVAIVTGSGSGLGRSFSLALAKAGASVACLERDKTSGVETVKLIREVGGEAHFHETDVADEESVESAVATCVADFGKCDVLINNAGIAIPPARAHETSIADWDRLMGINLRGSFLMTRAVLPTMLANNSGVVLNIASFIGLVGLYPDFPISGVAYASSKAAITGFTRQLALEYAKDGIRVNAIAPGWHGGTNLAREMRAAATPDDIARFEHYIKSSVPMGRRGTMEELSGLVLYLASDASSYVTGQVFAHDGGLTAG